MSIYVYRIISLAEEESLVMEDRGREREGMEQSDNDDRARDWQEERGRLY